MAGGLRLFVLAAAAILTTAASAPTDDLPLIAAAIRSGRLIQADLMLLRIPAASSGDNSPEVDILRAQLALAQGRDQEAKSRFDTLAPRMLDDCRVLVGGGIAESSLGNADVAIMRLERAAPRCDLDWDAWSALGRAYDVKLRWPDSDRAYARAIARGGQRPALLNDVAVSLIKQKRFAEATALLGTALTKAPSDARIVNNLDIAAGALGRMPVRGVTDTTSRWAERLNNAGYSAMLAGRTDDARRWLTAAVDADPVFQAVAAANLAQLDRVK
jgi:Flp pilus assembly protein TadD